jgi:hypothetical protein
VSLQAGALGCEQQDERGIGLDPRSELDTARQLVEEVEQLVGSVDGGDDGTLFDPEFLGQRVPE